MHWAAPSLYLQVREGQGTRSWLFRYSRDGENQWMGIGAYADKGFTEARDEAAMLRVLVKRGGDPMAEKRNAEAAAKPKAKAKAPTFADCADKYMEAHRSGWKNDKHIAQWESTLRMTVFTSASAFAARRFPCSNMMVAIFSSTNLVGFGSEADGRRR